MVLIPAFFDIVKNIINYQNSCYLNTKIMLPRIISSYLFNRNKAFIFDKTQFNYGL